MVLGSGGMCLVGFLWEDLRQERTRNGCPQIVFARTKNISWPTSATKP